jgi:CRP-like cAMP-binding protein
LIKLDGIPTYWYIGSAKMDAKLHTNPDLFFDDASPFKGASEKERKKIMSLTKNKEYQKNELLFDTTKPSPGYWGVVKGQIRLSKVNKNGELHIIKDFHQGDWVGFISYLSGYKSPHDAYTMKSSTILFLDKSAIETIYELFPHLYRSTASLVSSAFIRLAEHYNNTCNMPLISRVSSTLCRLHLFNKNLPLELSHAELAAYIGASREAVSTCLKFLEKSGGISLKYKNIAIKNLDILERLSYESNIEFKGGFPCQN